MKQSDMKFRELLQGWNKHAEIVMRGFKDPEDHALYSLWIRDELQTLLDIYVSLATLKSIGASCPTDEEIEKWEKR